MGSQPDVSPKPPPGAVRADAEAALDRLLEQVVTGFFVLTDGQGNLSKWSDPAEFLFGLPPDEALGEPLFGKLIVAPYGAEGEAWRDFLEQGVPPLSRSAATLTATHPDAGQFPVEAVFVPVKLDEGFDFSLFLEDLSFELPMDLMLLRMRQQHPVVINALRQALAAGPLPWEGWRTAGTLVIFSPRVETPWIDEAMRVREEQRRLMEEEAQSRIQAYEAPAVQGSDVRDLEDAAAVVERLRWATERIEDLEERSRIAEGAAHEVAEARQRAEAAEKAALEARAQLTEALTKADAEVIAVSEAERLEFNARLDRIERAAQEAAEAAAHHRIAADRERQRVGEAQRQALELGKRLEALERDLVATAEASRAAAAERARIEAEAVVQAATRDFAERIDAIEQARGDQAALAAAEGRAEASRAELQIRLEELERLQRDEWQQLREEVADLKVAAADAVEIRAQLKQMQAAVGEATSLRSDVARTREEVEALRRSGGNSQIVADIRRLDEQAAEVAALREELERVRGAASTVEPLRAQVDGVLERLEQVAQQVAGLRPGVDSQILRQHVGASADDQQRVREAQRQAEEARREAQEARAGLEALHAQAEEFRAQAVELREDAERLRAQLGELREDDGYTRNDLEGLRAEQKDIRELLEEARRERDESREQLTNVLREFEQAQKAAAEQAARSVGGTESQIHQRLERTAAEFAGVRRDAEDIRTRMAELAGTAHAAERRAAEAHAASDGVREQLIEVREETRDTARLARDAAERIERVDRGAANVLAEVQAQKEAVDAVAEEARTAGEAARAAGDAAEEGRAAAAEAKAAAERVEERLSSTGEQLETVTADIAAVRDQASAAAQAAEAARDEAVSAGREAAEEAVGRLREELETVRSDLDAARRDLDERLATDPAEALAAVQAEVTARLDELRSQVDAVAGSSEEAGKQSGAAIEALEQAVEALRADVGNRAAASDIEVLQAHIQGLRDRDDSGVMDAVRSRLDVLEQRDANIPAGALENLRADLETRIVAIESRDVESLLEARLGEMAAELMAARTETEAVRRSLDDLRHEMQAVREYAASAKAEGTSALQLATAAQTASAHTDHRVDELRGQIADGSRLLEELRKHADEVRRAAAAAQVAAERAASAEKGTSARFTEVWDELIKKSRSSGERRPSAAPKQKSKARARKPRPGFDDQDRPMAVIGLDGKFKELNPGFAKLIGYDEHEFQRAAWPSVHDRPVYQQQLAALREMVAGDRDSFQVQSTYMHGQGLMVPVSGRLELVRDDQGAPAHLLLVAEDRQHA